MRYIRFEKRKYDINNIQRLIFDVVFKPVARHFPSFGTYNVAPFVTITNSIQVDYVLSI